MRRRALLVLLALVALAGLAACGGSAAGNGDGGMSLDDADIEAADGRDSAAIGPFCDTPVPPGPVVDIHGTLKLDVLFVIEDGSGMALGQVALAKAVHLLPEQLAVFPDVDLHMAVVTMTDVGMGLFSIGSASGFAPSNVQMQPWACEQDLDCAEEFGADWECDPGFPRCSTGTPWGSCTYVCQTDDDCCGAFCGPAYEAANPAFVGDFCSDSAQGCGFECTENDRCLLEIPESEAVGNFEPGWILPFPNVWGSTHRQGLRAAWLALSPEGPNAETLASFVRSDALLLFVFLSDQEDCSIAEDFCSPSYECYDGKACPVGSTCRRDEKFSQLAGEDKWLCCGTIKEDYLSKCGMLAEYGGPEHHSCAYDLGCKDCIDSSDCPYGWVCEQDMKCRPDLYPLGNIASYQQPPGTPIFSLGPVIDYYERYRALKDDSRKVFVAALVGDGLVFADDQASLISQACLDNEKLEYCQEYKTAKASTSTTCLADPNAAGCEGLKEAKLKCIRDCYNWAHVEGSGYPCYRYVCAGNYGMADAGTRYVRLAEMFGDHGVAVNLCEPAAAQKTIEAAADLIKCATRVIPEPGM